jgi:hypothetical protein
LGYFYHKGHNMIKQDIIRMARQAGSLIEAVQEKDLQWLERFATLVASAEREACAKVCDSFKVPAQVRGAHPDYLVGKEMAASQLADAIRARGQA